MEREAGTLWVGGQGGEDEAGHLPGWTRKQVPVPAAGTQAEMGLEGLSMAPWGPEAMQAEGAAEKVVPTTPTTTAHRFQLRLAAHTAGLPGEEFLQRQTLT